MPPASPTKVLRRNASLVPFLARLEQGPIVATDWEGIAHSREAMRASVYRLRKMGYPIISKGKNGCKVTYILEPRRKKPCPRP